jgi:hypothetical protein
VVSLELTLEFVETLELVEVAGVQVLSLEVEYELDELELVVMTTSSTRRALDVELE